MNDPVREPGDTSSANDVSVAPPSARRRALLVALPSIVSLHPGVAAAQARYSIALPWTDDGLCAAEPAGAQITAKGWGFEQKPSEVRFVPENSYYKKTSEGEYEPVTMREMCDEPGDYYFSTEAPAVPPKPNMKVSVPDGSHMVSFASATGSFTFTSLNTTMNI